jgi:hypothetical protein
MTSDRATKIQRLVRPEALKKNEPLLWATRRGHMRITDPLARHGAR